MSKPGMFHVVPTVDLNPERDVYVGLPVETTNKQTFHRVPVRSASTESASGDRRYRVNLVPGASNVVQSVQGLRRLLLKFPSVFVPGIKVFEPERDGDRTNLSMGFAMYDHRVGPNRAPVHMRTRGVVVTPEEQRVLDNVDALAMFLRNTMVRCDKIRRTLKLGPDNMTVAQQQVAAEMMELHVARPAVDIANRPGTLRDNAAGGGTDERSYPLHAEPPLQHRGPGHDTATSSWCPPTQM